MDFHYFSHSVHVNIWRGVARNAWIEWMIKAKGFQIFQMSIKYYCHFLNKHSHSKWLSRIRYSNFFRVSSRTSFTTLKHSYAFQYIVLFSDHKYIIWRSCSLTFVLRITILIKNCNSLMKCDILTFISKLGVSFDSKCAFLIL